MSQWLDPVPRRLTLGADTSSLAPGIPVASWGPFELPAMLSIESFANLVVTALT